MSESNKFGTQPVLRILLIASRNEAVIICVSLNKKVTSVYSTPAFHKSVPKSS
jgi:hypothetical protein